MESEQISKWCEDKGIDPRRALVLSRVPLGLTDETMYKVLDEAQVFGPCKIRGRCVEHFSKSQLVLVETVNDMTKTDIPEQLLAGDEFGPWIVNVTETQSVHVTGKGDFQSKLLSFLANEGKTLADVTGFLTSASDLNTKLVNAISSLVEKCQATPVDGQGYRKLRMFSGMKPTPHGEEEYDAWAEQTTHMLDEWQCSDVVKRQRVAESLKGAAADIVRGLRVTNPQATANDYLKALETAFGTTDSAADLMVRFRNTFQQEGEKLSAYLLRLDKLLHAVHRKGGIEVIDMNRARTDQVARGSLAHDLVALRIRLTYKLKPPPSFTDLLRDVREEEEMILERPSVKKVLPEPALVPEVAEKDPAIESLRKEFQGLKTDVARLLSASVTASTSVAQQVDQNHSQKVTGNSYARVKERAPKPQYRADVFCYRCGEDGHFQRECQNAENLRKVNKRLLKVRPPTGNFPGAQ
ncbi:Paraneoplastic antigen [Triplophysa tibetana]|uniref:Paraneoplastic antigen n=1 Tax=Triplophysa tibetana TaxID=1572043 RepID=A0A5A9NGM2_9TELE|nr:Paraneoplastic antigen [Triplophysa tibetana]